MTVIKDMAEVHDDILMYEYKHKDVTDVVDFEEIGPKIGTTELIAGATAEPSTTDLSSLVLRQNFLQQIYDSKR